MAFERPTLPDLVRRIQADFVSRLALSGGALRRAVVNVLARVIAGATHMLHGHLEYLSRQLFPDTSDESYLLRQAALFGLSKTPATFSQVTVSGVGNGGTVTIDAGTVLTAQDSGAEYTVDADYSGTATSFTLDITASAAGAASRLAVNAVLNFQTPVTNAESTLTVTAVVLDGVDEETTEGLRERLRARLANPPQGGSRADYVDWARQVSGVTRAWVSPLELGPGTVVVRFVRDGDVTVIPDSGEVAAVQSKLDELAPAHATVTAAAPIALNVNMTVHIVPDNSLTRANVTAELADYILNNAAPGKTLLRSGLLTTIGNAGVTDFTLTSPAADVTATASQLTLLGTITWV